MNEEQEKRLHDVWWTMRGRCRSLFNVSYKYYGARGISVCKEWDEDYDKFRQWSLASGYSPGLSIDRVDNEGDYTPDNCRWATWKEQGKNRRNNKRVTYDGKTQTLAEWAEETGLPAVVLSRRLGKLHWPPYAALTIPLEKRVITP